MTPIWAPYGTAYSFRAPVIKANSSNFVGAVDWTPAAGQVKVIKDGGSAADISTLPTYISGQYTMNWSLSASEMASDEIIIQVLDRANTTDQMFRIITQPDGALRSRTIQSGSNNVIRLDSSASATDNIYTGAIITIIAGSGAGQQRVILQYNGTSKDATLDANVVGTLNSTSVYALYPQGIYGLTQSQVSSAVTTGLTSYGTSNLTSAQVQSAASAALTAYNASTINSTQVQSAAAAALISYGTSTLNSTQVQSAAAAALTAYGASTLTAAQVEAQIMDTALVETGMTVRQSMKLNAAVLLGRRTGTGSGSEAFYSAVSGSTKVRVVGTINTTTGDRTGVTLDAA